MRGIVLGLCVVLALPSCGRIFGQSEGGGAARITFDGIEFDAKLTPDEEDKRAFTVRVAKARRNLEAAQEAGRYEATKYCLFGYGASDTEWTVGPDDPVDSATLDETGALVLAGRCTAR